MAAALRKLHPAVQWWCPQLPPSPRLAMQQVMAGIAGWPQQAGFGSLAVVGSSLGGFYATAVAERCACRAVLLNPAVNPARDLKTYIGEQSAWHQPDEKFFFKAAHVDELRELHAGPLKAPKNYLAVVAKGDEVLDWREMADRYPGARIRLIEGSNHALSDFDLYLPEILDFLQLAGALPPP